jgi:hypothetical protein
MQFVDSACKGIRRVTDYLLQQPIRISASLLQAAGAGRYQIAACKTFVFSRIFSILHAVSDTFRLFAKRGQTTFRTETNGNLSKQCNTSDSDYSYIRQIFTCNFICEISQRIMFHRLEKLLVQIRAPAANCLRNPRIACNADNVGNIPLGKLNLKFKKWRQVLKFCFPSAVIISMRACST